MDRLVVIDLSSYIYPLFTISFDHGIPYGVAVRIPGFHPGGPGRLPLCESALFYSSCDMVVGFILTPCECNEIISLN